MDELQFERYKESLKKAKELTAYSSVELAAALLNVIPKEGGSENTAEVFDHPLGCNKKTSIAKVTKNNFVISLIIEKYGN